MMPEAEKTQKQGLVGYTVGRDIEEEWVIWKNHQRRKSVIGI